MKLNRMCDRTFFKERLVIYPFVCVSLTFRDKFLEPLLPTQKDVIHRNTFVRIQEELFGAGITSERSNVARNILL